MGNEEAVRSSEQGGKHERFQWRISSVWKHQEVHLPGKKSLL
jgi:hypothetical protein